jgi:hypothetical protein
MATIPLPVQVCTWHPRESGFDWEGATEPSVGDWLYCLKDTAPGDRQIVWSGVEGSGIMSVVDFSGHVRERAGKPGRYEGWGRITDLRRPLSVQQVLADPVLRRRFGAPIQSVYSLEPRIARAIEELAGGLPPAPSFDGSPPQWRAEGGDWGRISLPPEIIIEDVVRDNGRIARKLGFPSQVITQRRLGNGLRPDFWCADGVVGDAKNMVTAAWGPDQIEDYVEQCDAQWPENRWRGILVQGEPEMAPNALPRLKASPYRRRIEVWTVTKKGRTGRILARRLFPAQAS